MSDINIIELTVSQVEDNAVHICSSHTSYANERRIQIPTVPELLERRAKLAKLAKSLGVSVSYKNKTKNQLDILKNKIPELGEQYQKLFDKHRDFWKAQLNGGDTFHVDQVQSFDKGYELRNTIWAMFHRNQPLSQLREIESTLNTIEEFLKNSPSGGKIYL